MTSSWRREARLLPAFLLLFIWQTANAAAHDFWIEPSSFHPAMGSMIAVSLRVGEHFRGDPVPRDDARIVKFVLQGDAGEIPIGGLPATDPAGFAKISSPGFFAIGYRSNRSPITLEPEKFEKYLADEGLDAALETRAKRNERRSPGKEVYSRCAKSLISGNGTGRSGFDRVVGLTLELVAESSPLKLDSGRPMRFMLLYEGKPLAGALVKAVSAAEPDATLAARSERDGRVSFPLARKGIWLVKTVHMVPAPPETGADWESLWASLTFEVP